jgi:hypothetical protein
VSEIELALAIIASNNSTGDKDKFLNLRIASSADI